MAREPAKRTPTAEALLQQIEGALNAPGRRRQHRRALGRLVVAASLAVAVLAIGTALARRFPEHVQAALGAWTAVPAGGLAIAPPMREAKGRVEVSSTAMEPATVPLAASKEVSTRDGASEERQDPRGAAERAAARRDWQGALRWAQAWVEAESTVDASLFLARLLIHVDRGAEAVPVLEGVLWEEPGSREAASLLAVARRPLFEEKEPGAPAEVEEAGSKVASVQGR